MNHKKNTPLIYLGLIVILVLGFVVFENLSDSEKVEVVSHSEKLGSWVRGNLYELKDGSKSYVYIYDAGSDGGSGMNKFGEIVLH